MKNCTSLSCPERKSICCQGFSAPGYLWKKSFDFVCARCLKEFVGGECTAQTYFEIKHDKTDWKFETNMTKLEQLKSRIFELCPYLKTRSISVQIPKPFGGIINYRDTTIRLADLFVAFIKTWDEKFKQPQEKNYNGLQIEYASDELKIQNLYRRFNIEDDNLDHQSPEVIDYLFDILCKK